MATSIEKDAARLAEFMRALAELLDSYDMEMDDMHELMPRSQATIGPLDIPTIYPAVAKVDDEQRMVFGWAYVSEKDEGLVVDSDGESIEPAELEKAAYDYVLHARDGGELHAGEATGRLVESLMVTKEKAAAMGVTLPEGKTGWWVGFQFDPEAFAKVKNGEYEMFSVQGFAEEVIGG